jgi:hypothetical protein
MSNKNTQSKSKNPHYTEEDFLDVDNQIPGQNYVCLSYVSPEKTLVKKEQWMFYHYHQYVIKEYNKIFTELMEKVLDTDDDTVPVEKVADVVERMGRVYDMNEVEYTKWNELVEDYKFKEAEKLEQEFDKMNNFQTSVRGVKIRGVYDTLQEAQTRSKYLQRKDNRFDIFIGQVGYWLPWHPDVNRIQDQEYMNDELNTLVKEYKKNEEKRDMFYEEQKQKRIQEARDQVERAKALQAEKNKLETIEDDEEDEDENERADHIPITKKSNEQMDGLNDMDPWLKRKTENQ